MNGFAFGTYPKAQLPDGAVFQHFLARIEARFVEFGWHREQPVDSIALLHDLPEHPALHLPTSFADDFLPAHFPSDNLLF